jgi:hypothetical protein
VQTASKDIEDGPSAMITPSKEPASSKEAGASRAVSALVGYARVSRAEQDPAAQQAELAAVGAVRVFVDHGESSRRADRPQWQACLDYLRAGDTLVVRRLDRIAGTEKMAIETINELHERGINIKSLTEPDIDTTTPMGSCPVRHRRRLRPAARRHHPRQHPARPRPRTSAGTHRRTAHRHDA